MLRDGRGFGLSIPDYQQQEQTNGNRVSEGNLSSDRISEVGSVNGARSVGEIH
jgi:hypothetical protein